MKSFHKSVRWKEVSAIERFYCASVNTWQILTNEGLKFMLDCVKFENGYIFLIYDVF